jgi:pimeloyl-ACP methyl ester carboxylesterase
MATFVLLHAGWAGGWQWRTVAQRLRATGHEVFTPTFTGLGERAHLTSPEVGLETHIQDVLGVLIYEDLHDVVLVGHSYSGMVSTAVAERMPERLAQLVYVDAFVPQDGQSLNAIVGPALQAYFVRAARSRGDGWRIPHDPLGAPRTPRMTDQPLKTGEQIVSVQNPVAAALPHTYIACTQKSPNWAFTTILEQTAARVLAEGWRYHELPTGHYPMETMPHILADMLRELVEYAPSRPDQDGYSGRRWFRSREQFDGPLSVSSRRDSYALYTEL